MLLNFQNVEDIKKVLDNLTSYEKLELANNIYIGRNQSDFIDSKGNSLEELKTETEINNFYEELNNIFIKIYNNHKKVEKYLIQKLQESYKYFDIDEKDINKIDLQYLDDRCAEIFEY
jgi:hypothetical protein